MDLSFTAPPTVHHAGSLQVPHRQFHRKGGVQKDVLYLINWLVLSVYPAQGSVIGVGIVW